MPASILLQAFVVCVRVLGTGSVEISELNPTTGSPLSSFTVVVATPIRAIAVSPSGKRLAIETQFVSSKQPTIAICDLVNRRIEKSVNLGKSGAFYSELAWSSDEELLLCGGKTMSSGLYVSLRSPFDKYKDEGMGFATEAVLPSNGAPSALAALRRVAAAGVAPMPAIQYRREVFALGNFLPAMTVEEYFNPRSGALCVIGSKGNQFGLWWIAGIGSPELIEGRVNRIEACGEVGSTFLALVSSVSFEPSDTNPGHVKFSNRHALAFDLATRKVLWRRACDFFAVPSKPAGL
ncbi:MAG: hypothetical protein ACHQ50_01710 [Fimbriimonadales bacterium]